MKKIKHIYLLAAFVALFLVPSSLQAQRRYSGSRHTTSHGGHYSGGSGGSSHKGGSYKNSNTGNHYGRHKK